MPDIFAHDANISAALDTRESITRSRNLRFGEADSYAMMATANTRTCYYRSGYDFALPLTTRVTFLELSSIPPNERKYFLTFKVSGA